MFTGIVETSGRVIRVVPGEGATRLAIETPFAGELAPGESVAVDGVCLTVADLPGGAFEADVVAETLSRTTLGDLVTGARVNLERSLRAGDRLGGHLVQGHVDTTARVLEVSQRGADRRLKVESSAEYRRFLAEKGSVALQGVSLTIARVAADAFEVALIPETCRRTTLGEVRKGDRLNLEVDLVARYLDTLLEPRKERRG